MYHVCIADCVIKRISNKILCGPLSNSTMEHLVGNISFGFRSSACPSRFERQSGHFGAKNVTIK